MPTAVEEKGLKRICPSCGTRYYDFNRRPVVCPSCETEFSAELKVKTRRSRPAAAEEEKPGVDEDSEAGTEDTVSLDEVEEMEEGEDSEDEVEGDLDIDDTLDIDEDMDDEDMDEDVEVDDSGEKA